MIVRQMKGLGTVLHTFAALAAYLECAGRVFPRDRLPVNPGFALSSCARIYRQEEAELIQGNSCFSHT